MLREHVESVVREYAEECAKHGANVDIYNYLNETVIEIVAPEIPFQVISTLTEAEGKYGYSYSSARGWFLVIRVRSGDLDIELFINVPDGEENFRVMHSVLYYVHIKYIDYMIDEETGELILTATMQNGTVYSISM